MCRNIRTLFNFEPPVTPEEVHAASLQFVRKITGFNKPSKANEEAFEKAIEDIAKDLEPFATFAGNDRGAEESRRRSRQSQGSRRRALRKQLVRPAGAA